MLRRFPDTSIYWPKMLHLAYINESDPVGRGSLLNLTRNRNLRLFRLQK